MSSQTVLEMMATIRSEETIKIEGNERADFSKQS